MPKYLQGDNTKYYSNQNFTILDIDTSKYTADNIMYILQALILTSEGQKGQTLQPDTIGKLVIAKLIVDIQAQTCLYYIEQGRALQYTTIKKPIARIVGPTKKYIVNDTNQLQLKDKIIDNRL